MFKSRHEEDVLLQEEHRAFDRILGEVELLSERGNFEAAAKRFHEFRRALEEHMSLEDQVLLPLFVAHAPNSEATLAAIQLEHGGIRVLIGKLAAALSAAEHAGLGALARELNRVLRTHHQHEERMLNPVLEPFLGDPEEWKRRMHELKWARLF